MRTSLSYAAAAFVMLATLGRLTSSHRCVHDSLNVPITVMESSLTHQSERAAVPFQPIRLVFDLSLLSSDPAACFTGSKTYTDSAGATLSCTADMILTADKVSLIKSLVADSEARYESVLMVRPEEDIVWTGKRICRSAHPAKNYTGVDMVIFVSSQPMDAATYTGVLAVASSCIISAVSGRPLVGFIQFNPIYLTPGSALQSQLGTALHELAHALGFSSGNTAFSSLVTTDSTTVATLGHETKLVTSAGVVSFLRSHSGCSSLAGAELEDGGGTGTKGSHWEKRVFMNEFMTGSSSPNPVFSRLTLNLFADLGYYSIDWTNSNETLLWGAGKGCDFFRKKCSAASWTSDIFCSTAGSSSCSFDRESIAFCNIVEWPAASLPEYASYGLTGTQGGNSLLADYCPFYTGVQFCNVLPSEQSKQQQFCDDISSCPADFFSVIPGTDSGQEWTSSSRCFMYQAPVLSTTFVPQCFRTHCVGPTLLVVKPLNVTYFHLCSKAGEIQLTEHLVPTGKIMCPDPASICFDAPPNTNWPLLTSITPGTGQPSSTVTIRGRNFISSMSVLFNYDTASSIVVFNSSYLTCNLPAVERFKDLRSISGFAVPLTLANDAQHAIIYREAYTVLQTAEGLLKAYANWAEEHIWQTALICLGIVILFLLCGLCIFCMCRRKKNARGHSMKP